MSFPPPNGALDSPLCIVLDNLQKLNYLFIYWLFFCPLNAAYNTFWNQMLQVQTWRDFDNELFFQ